MDRSAYIGPCGAVVALLAVQPPPPGQPRSVPRRSRSTSTAPGRRIPVCLKYPCWRSPRHGRLYMVGTGMAWCGSTAFASRCSTGAPRPACEVSEIRGAPGRPRTKIFGSARTAADLRLQSWQVQTFDTKSGLSSDSILALHEDNQGVLWIGTDGGG